jgi:hypothetical protein
MISAAEWACPMDLDLLDRASAAIVAELRDPHGDAERYARCVALLRHVHADLRWWLDLAVVAECWANDVPVRPDLTLRPPSR